MPAHAETAGPRAPPNPPPASTVARPAWLHRAVGLGALSIAFTAAAGLLAGAAYGLASAPPAQALWWAVAMAPVLAPIALLDVAWSRHIHGDHIRLRLGHAPEGPSSSRCLTGASLAGLRLSMASQDGEGVAAHLDWVTGRRPVPITGLAIATQPRMQRRGSTDAVLRAVPYAWWATAVLWAMAWTAAASTDASLAVAGAAAATLLCAAATAVRMRTRWRRADLDEWITWYQVHGAIVPDLPVPTLLPPAEPAVAPVAVPNAVAAPAPPAVAPALAPVAAPAAPTPAAPVAAPGPAPVAPAEPAAR